LNAFKPAITFPTAEHRRRLNVNLCQTILLGITESQACWLLRYDSIR